MIPRPTPEQIERTRTLYAVISGVPALRVDLTYWRAIRVADSGSRVYCRNELSNTDLMNDCGTVACGMGYAAAYPPFVADGLHMAEASDGFWQPTFEGHGGFRAAVRFFGMTEHEAGSIFGSHSGGTRRDDFIRGEGAADRMLDEKPRLLRRLRRYLLHVGAITAERNAELARMEGSPE